VTAAGGAAAARPRALARFALKTAGLWSFCLALVAGNWTMVEGAAVAAALVALGFLPVLSGRRGLHDRLTGTDVCR